MSVQGVPKYGAGLYLYSMPLGGDGLLGILGMFGLCLALLVAVVFVLERFPSYNPARAGHWSGGDDMTDKTNQQDDLQDAGRRKVIAQGAAVAGGLAVFAAGYSETVSRAVTGLVHGSAGTPTADAVRGNSLTPEFR